MEPDAFQVQGDATANKAENGGVEGALVDRQTISVDSQMSDHPGSYFDKRW